jgi:hypothetical protein
MWGADASTDQSREATSSQAGHRQTRSDEHGQHADKCGPTKIPYKSDRRGGGERDSGEAGLKISSVIAEKIVQPIQKQSNSLLGTPLARRKIASKTGIPEYFSHEPLSMPRSGSLS